jgi:hypothetical protein
MAELESLRPLVADILDGLAHTSFLAGPEGDWSRASCMAYGAGLIDAAEESERVEELEQLRAELWECRALLDQPHVQRALIRAAKAS